MKKIISFLLSSILIFSYCTQAMFNSMSSQISDPDTEYLPPPPSMRLQEATLNGQSFDNPIFTNPLGGKKKSVQFQRNSFARMSTSSTEEDLDTLGQIILSGDTFGFIHSLQHFQPTIVGIRHPKTLNTLLHLAAASGRYEISAYLLQSSFCQINSQNHRGETALHLAVTHQHIPIIDLLLRHQRINPELSDCDGATALNRAETIENERILSMFALYYKEVKHYDLYTSTTLLSVPQSLPATPKTPPIGSPTRPTFLFPYPTSDEVQSMQSGPSPSSVSRRSSSNPRSLMPNKEEKEIQTDQEPTAEKKCTCAVS